jgi:hypothetical protein
MEPFRLRLNCLDHYQSFPTELDPPLPDGIGISQRQDRPKVPVIRAFGATETGQKVCAHVHGAFPYLYIEYRGSLGADEGEIIRSVCTHIADTHKFIRPVEICISLLTKHWRPVTAGMHSNDIMPTWRTFPWLKPCPSTDIMSAIAFISRSIS